MSLTLSEIPQQEQSFADKSSARPINLSSRIQSLDVLRGIAVLGALFISILLLGGLSQNQQNGLLLKSHGLNHTTFVALNVLLNGKMRAIISIVFGASMLLYLFKGKERGQLYNGNFFIRRQLWLIAFGLINALVFLWTGDVLFHLGIMGVLLFPLVRLSARGLLIAAFLATLIYSGKVYWRYTDDQKIYNKYIAIMAVEKKITADSVKRAKQALASGIVNKDSLSKKQKKDTLTKKQMTEKQAWEGYIKNMKYDPKKDDEKIKAMRYTSYGKIWDSQLGDTQWREAVWTYSYGIWNIGSMMLLGMALYRFGFFDSRLHSKKYLLLSLTGITVGLLLAWLRLHYNRLTLLDYTKYISSHPLPYDLFFPFEVAFMALGYVSLILLLINTGWLKRMWHGFAIVGQMALTNYLSQSVICLIFFTGFGMGYFARLQQWQLYVFACEIVLVNIAFSIIWLRHFQYGPAEWLIRCLIHKKWLLNRISKTGITQPVTIVL